METFSALLALCGGKPLVIDEFLSQMPVTQSFAVSLICAWAKFEQTAEMPLICANKAMLYIYMINVTLKADMILYEFTEFTESGGLRGTGVGWVKVNAFLPC